MNQTIRTTSQLHSSIHQRRIESSEWSTRAAPRIQFEKHPRKTLLGKLRRALIAIAVLGSVAVAVVVIRLVAFQPGFVEMLKRAARLLATALSL